MNKPKFATLSNGIRLVAVELPHSSTVSTGIWVGVGSRHEPPELYGISHFIEHCVFKGTRKWPTSLLLAKEIEQTGGELNAETSREYTGYTAHVPAENWETALDVLLDMVSKPLFKKSDIDCEKGVVIEEIASYEDDPAELVIDLFKDCLWKGLPLGHSELGNEESISRFCQKKLRMFLNKFYLGRNMVISLAGNFCFEEVCSWLEKRAAGIKNSAPDKIPGLTRFPKGPQINSRMSDFEQSHICLGFRTSPRGSDDRYALQLIRTILGGGMGSRLFQELREKRGIAYNISVQRDSYRDTGAMSIYAGVDRKRVAETIQAVMQILDQIKTEHIAAEELKVAKQQLVGQLTILTEDQEILAELLGTTLLLEDELYEQQAHFTNIQNSTADDIYETARKYFSITRGALIVIGKSEDVSVWREV